MQCDEGCGECCGIVPVTETEYARVERFIKEHKITPVEDLATCPFYQGGKCAVYPVRPLICKVFGHGEDPLLRCIKGYNTNVPTRDIERMIAANGMTTRVLHDMVPGFRKESEKWAATQTILQKPDLTQLSVLVEEARARK